MRYGRQGDGRTRPRHRIEYTVPFNVVLGDEQGSATRLQHTLDELDKDCFHFTLERCFDGATGREAFLKRRAHTTQRQRQGH